jgi:hypothetical protein
MPNKACLPKPKLTISTADVSSEAGGGARRCPRKAVMGTWVASRPGIWPSGHWRVTWPSLTVYTIGMAGTVSVHRVAG